MERAPAGINQLTRTLSRRVTAPARHNGARRVQEARPARGAVGGDGSKAPLQVNCADLSEELEPFLPMATLL